MDDLFGTQERQAMALARTNNPQTSKDAAKKIVESGELNRQEEQVYGTITRYVMCHTKDDFITKDIAIGMWPMPYHKAYDICRKRFSGLRDKGKIELTGGRRDSCRVWRLL